jgi:hypothetical protein
MATSWQHIGSRKAANWQQLAAGSEAYGGAAVGVAPLITVNAAGFYS